MAISSTVHSVTLVLIFALFLSFTEGRDHLVGGKTDSWKVPSSESNSLNKWAQKTRFQIGDYLVFRYESKKGSVLKVTREAYLSCNTSSSPTIKAHKEGETIVKLGHSGPYYFISGSQSNCEKGQKVIVVVMAAQSAVSPAPSPSSTASEFEGPAVAPTSGGCGLELTRAIVSLGVLLGFLML